MTRFLAVELDAAKGFARMAARQEDARAREWCAVEAWKAYVTVKSFLFCVQLTSDERSAFGKELDALLPSLRCLDNSARANGLRANDCEAGPAKTGRENGNGLEEIVQQVQAFAKSCGRACAEAKHLVLQNRVLMAKKPDDNAF